MSVRFVIGPAGSGKTHFCLESLRALERQGKPGVFLVPEQSTYSADRELLEARDLAGLRHVRVLSFSRLASWLRELSGEAEPPVLPEAVRPMLLRRVLALLPDERLGPLAPMRNQQGLMEELGRCISEIRAHGTHDFLDTLRRACAPTSSARAADGLASSSGAAGSGAAAAGAAGPGSIPIEEGWPAGTREKLTTLGAVFEAYDTALRDLGRLDPEERLAGCEPLIAGLSATLAGIRFFVDGFLSFTRREREILLALARTGTSCEITFCSDEPPDRTPFLPIRRSRELLRGSLERAGIPLDPPLVLAPRVPPGANGPGLAQLERCLYSDAEPAAGAGPVPLTLQAARDPRQEVLLWARQIDRWIRLQAQPVRPSQIAVILRSVEPYRDHIQEVFPRYGIPYFLDERRGLLGHPRVRLILEAFEVLLSGWRRSAVIGFLRNPLLGAPPAAIDLLDNLSLELGYDFEKWYTPVWEEVRTPGRVRPNRSPEAGDGDSENGEEAGDAEADGTTEDEAEEEVDDLLQVEASSGDRVALVNALRLRLTAPLREMERAWLQGGGSGGGVAAGATGMSPAGGAYPALTGLEAVAALERMLAAYENKAPQRRDPDPEWSSLVRETLDQLMAEARQLWGDVGVPLEEFARALRQGFRAARVGLTPRRLEQVVVGDVRRSRLSEIRCAVVGGLNEGLFPLAVADDLILTETDRAALGSYGISLGPSASDRQEEEIYFFYIALTRARETCLLTWSRTDDQGGLQAPSLLLRELARTVPGLAAAPPATDPGRATLEALQTPEELGERLALHLKETPAATGGAGGAAEARAGGAGRMESAAGDPAVWDRILRATWNQVAPAPGAPETSEALEAENADPLPATRESLVQRLPSILYKTESTLPEDLARRNLEGGHLVSSVLRLEQYAACPYQSFAQRTLELEPRPRAEISPLQTGQLAHRALERFFRSDVDPDYKVLRPRLAAIFRELRVHPDFLAFDLDPASQQRWEATRLSLERFLMVETVRLRGSSYKIHAREDFFGTSSGNPVSIPLADGQTLLLVGRIDRLDVREEGEATYALVVDYKRSARTGLPKKLEEGRDLQLAAYLLYVRDVLGWIPAGGVYIPVLPSPLRVEKMRAESENPLKIQAHGLFLLGERAEIDAGTDMLAQLRKNARQAIADGPAMDRLLDRGRDFLASFAATQLSGWIAPEPLEQQGGKLPCERCDYQALCRFRTGRDPVRRQPAEGMLNAPPPIPEARS